MRIRPGVATLACVSDEPELEWDERSALILALMRIEAKLDALLELWEDEENGEEESDA